MTALIIKHGGSKARKVLFYFSSGGIYFMYYAFPIQGEILCNSEIKEYIWIGNDYRKQKIRRGSILENV